MAKKHQVVFNVSTAPNLLHQAEEVLTLATENRSNRAALCGCITIMVAFALEQGVNSAISFNAQRMALQLNIPAEQTPYGKLAKEPFRDRMQHLPELVTDGQFRLNYQSDIPSCLDRLIRKRNKLAHVSEPAIYLETPDSRVTEDDNYLHIRYPMPDIIWMSISLKEAEEYVLAVRCYLSEVLFPGDEGHKRGELLLDI